jgi:hypothetical protein
MIHFFGNCQTGFLQAEAQARGWGSRMHTLASPLTWLESPGEVPPALAAMVERHGAADWLYQRSLRDQFELPGAAEPLELVVFNLFHEPQPLFVHRREGWCFFIDPGAMQADPGFGAYLEREFRAIRLNPDTYLQRFCRMLLALRQARPAVPVLVLSRLGHYPAFGPWPYSYLDGWERWWSQAGQWWQALSREMDGLHVLDLDRVFAGVLGESEPVEAHCPFLKVGLERDDSGAARLSLRRDLEHVGTLWSIILDKIQGLRERGVVEYRPEEQVPGSWTTRPCRPERPGTALLRQWLASGGNYHCARAVGSFFWDLGRDRTDLLVEAAPHMPVCHNTLHMIKYYGRVTRNPALAEWCRAHRERARAFTANGEAYRARYLDTLAEMEREAEAPAPARASS